MNRCAGTRAWWIALVVLGAPSVPAQAGEAACHPALPDDRSRAQAGYTASFDAYKIPELTLLDQSGRKRDLPTLLSGDEDTIVSFVFTTCTTICPVMTSTLAAVQRESEEAGGTLRLVSISIDPEHDRPQVLARYAARFRAGGDWLFLTGEERGIRTVLRAFDADFGDKMNHRPLYFLRRSGAERWLRVEGLARGSDIARELQALSAEATAPAREVP